MIIGISGTNSSGKDTVAKYIESKGFFHVSLSDIIREEMGKENIGINRDNMIAFSNDFGQAHGAEILAKMAFERYGNLDKLVISSVRKPAEVDFFHSIPDFKLIFVDVPAEIRYDRMLKRGREGEDILSFEDFRTLQEKEMNGTNSQNLSYCKEKADYVINNSNTINILYEKIDEIIEK
ncbi:MAG: AAA family ATPase [Patescibacteria group bacterium]|jgi:dephospho-CoA kinase|nr:AAA family ATPase [Patescibacteria group bacterium]